MKTQLLFTLLCAAVLFNPNVSLSSECDDVAYKIINKVGGKVVRRSSTTFTIRHVLSEKMAVNCGASPDFYITANTSHLSKKYLYLIGQAGSAVTGEDADTIIEAANQCSKEALASSDTFAQANLGRIRVNCQYLIEDTGRNSFTIALNEP